MIRLGFVGCGGIMQEHYKHLSAMSGIKMAGHCDIIKERAESAASRFGGDAFTEFESMYDKVKPQAVYVAVPPYAHCARIMDRDTGGMEEGAAERGIHLFIEKPIAINRETAKRIEAAVRKAKIITSVGYCFRYYNTIETARQILNGKPVSLIRGSWNGGMPGVWWWRRMDKSGGQIVEQTTHMFDLMRYLCGEVAEVYAVTSEETDVRFEANRLKQLQAKQQTSVALRIVSKGVDDHVRKKMVIAGANAVVSPAAIGGLRMVSELLRPATTGFLDTMLRQRTSVRFDELVVGKGSQLSGKTLAEADLRQIADALVVAARHPGQESFIYNPKADFLLEPDCVIVVLAQVAEVDKVRPLFAGQA